MSETITPPGCLLPELPSAEHFSEPLYAAIAKAFWEDDTLITLGDAVPKVAEAMTPQELLAATKVLDGLTRALDDHIVTASMDWIRIDDSSLTVDAEGMIHGILGHVSAVRRCILDSDTIEWLCDEMRDVELDETFFRAGRDGPDIASFIYDEEDRRAELKREREADASELATAPKLFDL